MLNPVTKAQKSKADDQGTKERLLQTALHMFAESGFDAVSIRDLTSAAEANLGAIGYHFGSKDDLIKAVFDRLAIPVNERRLAQLDAYERTVKEKGPSIEGVVRALIEPAVRFAKDKESDGVYYSRILDIAYTMRPPVFTEMMRAQYDEIARRFINALAQALPELPRDEVVWRYTFTIGAMLHILDDADHADRVKTFSKGRSDSSNPEEIIEKLVPYVVGGITAPGTLGNSAKSRNKPRRGPKK
jgi:AcrR family transcriptional regulator